MAILSSIQLQKGVVSKFGASPSLKHFSKTLILIILSLLLSMGSSM
jgi:hypothetical protein